MEEKYLRVLWPCLQLFMEHPRFNESYLLQAFDGQQHYNAAYFVPEDLYREFRDEILEFQKSERK